MGKFPTHPLVNSILVYNVNGTANEAGIITEITYLVLCHDSHSKYTQFVVTFLGKQSIILGYNWLFTIQRSIGKPRRSRCLAAHYSVPLAE
jgi:hypothetical protein